MTGSVRKGVGAKQKDKRKVISFKAIDILSLTSMTMRRTF